MLAGRPLRAAPIVRTLSTLAALGGLGAIGLLCASDAYGAKDPPAADVAITLLDRSGTAIDLVRSGLEISRVAPMPLGKDPLAPATDPDDVGFRPLLVGNSSNFPTTLDIVSHSASGKTLDSLRSIPLREIACPSGTPGVSKATTCATTVPLRIVLDDVDRTHPLVLERSLKGELEGKITLSAGEREWAAATVLGPRNTAVGAIDHMRGKLRVILVRERPSGAPPFGSDEPTAIALARIQIAHTNMIWGQCGIDFGPPDKADVKVVDPPQGHMLAIGCDLGAPASGGEIHVQVDGHDVKVTTTAGDPPRTVAREVAKAIEAKGFKTQISENARIGPGSLPTTDVLVRRRGGGFAQMTLPEGTKGSTDASMSLCVGKVDPSDGLQHFSDVDAVAGSLEERSLLKAFDDGDPTTIEVVFVTSFNTGGRIGESFIRGDRSSLTNMMIVDRAGVRADQVSFALAHELGHVLLDVPGHSDDYGQDTAFRLMDSDAADASVFGPRRLIATECARAVRQSGPIAPTPLLMPWRPSPAPAKP